MAASAKRSTATGIDKIEIRTGNYNRGSRPRPRRANCCRCQKRPQAIFVANDHMAVAVMDVARYEFGLSIPDDLSIVGYDDVGPARWPSYGITSVTQPIEPMVEATVDILMDQIASGEIEPQHKVLAG